MATTRRVRVVRRRPQRAAKRPSRAPNTKTPHDTFASLHTKGSLRRDRWPAGPYRASAARFSAGVSTASVQPELSTNRRCPRGCHGPQQLGRWRRTNLLRAAAGQHADRVEVAPDGHLGPDAAARRGRCRPGGPAPARRPRKRPCRPGSASHCRRCAARRVATLRLSRPAISRCSRQGDVAVEPRPDQPGGRIAAAEHVGPGRGQGPAVGHRILAACSIRASTSGAVVA